MKIPVSFAQRNKGFTLVEIIVGIVVLSIALTLITSLIVPAARQSVSPVYQVRAVTLGQALLNDIMGKSFDEQSSRTGGRLRCGDYNAPPCSTTLGPTANELDPSGAVIRERLNDVDDFHCLTNNPNMQVCSSPRIMPLQNALGDSLAARYPNYLYEITLCYSDASGQCLSSGMSAFKRVLVTIITPDGQRLDFSAIRGNF